MAIEFSEDFDQGPLGAKVTSQNTDFWSVQYDLQEETDEYIRLVFTDDAYAGLAAVIPVDSVPIDTDETQEMLIIGSSPDGLIIDEPVDITWFYKFEAGTLPFFGRYVFDADFDLLGTPVLTDLGDGWMYPDPDFHTSLYVALEHSNLDPGDDPDAMYYYHSNFDDIFEPDLPPYDVIEPQFPRSTWLKMRFTWQGAGQPFTLKVTDAADESVVHMDVTHTAPEGIGLSYWRFSPQTYNYSDAGYFFQSWFDGISVVPVVTGETMNSRVRFVTSRSL